MQERLPSSRGGRRTHIGTLDPDPFATYWLMTANIFRLIQAIHAAPDRSPAALAALFRKYDSELLEE